MRSGKMDHSERGKLRRSRDLFRWYEGRKDARCPSKKGGISTIKERKLRWEGRKAVSWSPTPSPPKVTLSSRGRRRLSPGRKGDRRRRNIVSITTFLEEIGCRPRRRAHIFCRYRAIQGTDTGVYCRGRLRNIWEKGGVCYGEERVAHSKPSK